jgi:multidrug efflux pump subunit AcrB
MQPIKIRLSGAICQLWRVQGALLAGFFLLGCCATVSNTATKNFTESADNDAALISLTTPQGSDLLYRSQAKQDFLPLSIHFVTQQNRAYCGAASMVMVLNALGLTAPVDPTYSPYPMFTQNNVFNVKTERIIGVDKIARQGVTLEQLGRLLASYPVQAQVIYSSDSSLVEFREQVRANLKEAENFVLVNYLRKTIGQQTGGHISPLAAYDEASDRLLILDVSRYKYPPVWVKTAHLWRAMTTVDDASKKSRGYLLIRRLQHTETDHD